MNDTLSSSNVKLMQVLNMRCKDLYLSLRQTELKHRNSFCKCSETGVSLIFLSTLDSCFLYFEFCILLPSADISYVVSLCLYSQAVFILVQLSDFCSCFQF